MSAPARLRRFVADDGGNATLEFVVLIPFLTFFMLALGEIGVFMTRHVNLDRSLDLAMRDVRLGDQSALSPDGLRTRICDQAFLVADCSDTLMIELTSLGASGAFAPTTPTGGVTCRNRTMPIQPVLQFDASGPGEIVIVRACVVVDPMFPATGFMALLPASFGGGYAVLAESAVVTEPE